MAHLHLLRSHCAGKAKKCIQSLPTRQRSTGADLIAALRSAFDNANEEETRDAQAHRAMLELDQRKGEAPPKYARRAYRISEHIDPRFDHFLTLKYLDGVRSRSLQRHLALDGRTEAAGKPTFDTTYKPFLGLGRVDRRGSNGRSVRVPSVLRNPNRTLNRVRIVMLRKRVQEEKVKDDIRP